MGRRRNLAAENPQPICPKGHLLARTTADGTFECDTCHQDITEGTCFFGCMPCDYCLCGGCYVTRAQEILENPALLQIVPVQEEDEPQLDSDVLELCEHFQIEERIMLKLNEAMKTRKETKEGDMEKLWDELEKARSPAGLLMAKVTQMKDGKFIGKVKPSGEVLRIIKEYKLDEDASSKLTDLIAKRPDTRENDLFEIERRLQGTGNRSAVVIMMIVKLSKGENLPPLREAEKKWQGPQDNKPRKDDDKSDRPYTVKKNRSRSRTRDRERKKSRSKSRSRSRSKSRSKKKSRSRSKKKKKSRSRSKKKSRSRSKKKKKSRSKSKKKSRSRSKKKKKKG
eukprot:gnl/MRDRNA2_/MRDRNA2_133668_c0_seq1.p1 gnl/MRDRNA2_/MRDRNA2_133668_c0~~gnl/MRDRNA2_/MRDRNA2_133668_c0_seq1.p1  ORF type:complete len:339 (-),score=76.57 gnl/MRDRNA2_/MRDRNA2_133668_c0_seq1:69-1085(-)